MHIRSKKAAKKAPRRNPFGRRLRVQRGQRSRLLDQTDIEMLLGVSERTARGYIYHPERIPAHRLELLLIKAMGLIQGLSEDVYIEDGAIQLANGYYLVQRTNVIHIMYQMVAKDWCVCQRMGSLVQFCILIVVLLLLLIVLGCFVNGTYMEISHLQCTLKSTAFGM